MSPLYSYQVTVQKTQRVDIYRDDELSWCWLPSVSSWLHLLPRGEAEWGRPPDHVLFRFRDILPAACMEHTHDPGRVPPPPAP